MPAYWFSCPTEGCATPLTKLWLWAIPKDKPTPPQCPTHGIGMERDYHAEHVGHIPKSVFPFVHDHLPGKPTILSEAHYQETCKRISLEQSGGTRDDLFIPRPDKGFVEDTVVQRPGYDVEYVEGSGQGQPGCWTNMPSLLNYSQDEINEFFERNSR